MSIVEECPVCGGYTTTPDGREDTFVVSELCERCRNRERNQSFDEGFAEYEAARDGGCF
jgi:hypothetical protein